MQKFSDLEATINPMPNVDNLDKLVMVGGILPVKLLPPRYSPSSFSKFPYLQDIALQAFLNSHTSKI
jgi:hypothetical protein